MDLKARSITYHCRCGHSIAFKPNGVNEFKRLRKAGWQVTEDDAVMCPTCKKATAKFPAVQWNKNYRRLSDPSRVFTGQQIATLLLLVKPAMQAIILLDIQETDDPPTNAWDRYGVADNDSEASDGSQ